MKIWAFITKSVLLVYRKSFEERGDRMGLSRLTERELEVLRLIADGLEQKQVAVQLRISQSTVASHLASIYAKLGVSNAVHAASTAFRGGVIH